MTENSTGTKTRGARGNTRGAGGKGITGASRTRGNKGGNPAPVAMPTAAPVAQAMDYTKANKLRISSLKKSIAVAQKMGAAIAKSGQQNKAYIDTLHAEQKQLEEA